MNSLQSTRATPRHTGDESAVDSVVLRIKSYIQENDLKVGDHLPSERELGEKFDAARNTVREAVRILKAYGVVEVRPKVGAVIVNRHMDAALDLFSFQLDISRDVFMDIQNFRKLIEVGSADMLFDAATAQDIVELKVTNNSLLDSKSIEEAAQRDFDFHHALLSVAGNKTVLNVYTTMKSIITRLMETGKEADGVEGTHTTHTHILDALIARDRLAFQYIMTKHLEKGLAYIDQSIESRNE
jgi:DNA-binding FadR family transcriptional regulator